MDADKILAAAEELSADKAKTIACGSADYLHVAAARRLNLLSEVDEFWSCDAQQAGLAALLGLKTKLFSLTG
jgi:hypothetical protein